MSSEKTSGVWARIYSGEKGVHFDYERIDSVGDVVRFKDEAGSIFEVGLDPGGRGVRVRTISRGIAVRPEASNLVRIEEEARVTKYRILEAGEVLQEGDVTAREGRPAEERAYPDEEIGVSTDHWPDGFWMRKVTE